MSTSVQTGSRWGVALLAAPLLLLIAVVALVARGSNENLVGYQAVPGGGTNVSQGPVKLDDVWLDAPHGVAVGGDAGLRLTLIDTSGAPDADLTGVTSPDVRHAVMRLGGHVVRDIRIPSSGDPVNMEWGRDSGIELTGFTHAVTAGYYIPLTLHYADGTSQELQVVAGPLGGVTGSQA